MPQFDRRRVVAKGVQQPIEIVSGFGHALEAEWKLDQKRSELAGRRERFNPAFERVDIRRRHRSPVDGHTGMRELLIQLHRELEILRRAFHPSEGGVGAGLAVKGAVDLDGVEALGIEAQLVKAAFAILGKRVEDAVPGALAGGVVPARGPDSQRHPIRIIGWSLRYLRLL